MIRPILFNTEMVKVILEGRKTVTRRIIKPQPTYCTMSKAGLVASEEPIEISDGIIKAANAEVRRPPFEAGDILYVRETWAPGSEIFDKRAPFIYRADYDDCIIPRWRPSIHMPKEATRLFLRVTDIRVERLQDIDGLGAFDEGAVAEMPGACLPPNKPDGFDGWSADKQNEYLRSMATSAYIAKLEFANRLIKAFSKVWDSTIKPADLPLYGWEANPWVWVIDFNKFSKLELAIEDGDLRVTGERKESEP